MFDKVSSGRLRLGSAALASLAEVSQCREWRPQRIRLAASIVVTHISVFLTEDLKAEFGSTQVIWLAILQERQTPRQPIHIHIFTQSSIPQNSQT